MNIKQISFFYQYLYILVFMSDKTQPIVMLTLAYRIDLMEFIQNI